jgi:hypothetical protein
MKNQINSAAVRKEVQAAEQKANASKVKKENNALIIACVVLWVGVFVYAFTMYFTY